MIRGLHRSWLDQGSDQGLLYGFCNIEIFMVRSGFRHSFLKGLSSTPYMVWVVDAELQICKVK